MWRLKDWLRFTVISFETLYILLAIAAYTRMPDFFAAIGRRLSGDLKILDVIYGIPLGCLVFSYPLMNKIIFPDESLKRTLKKWPQFIGLIDRVYFALIVIGSCSIGAIITRFIGLAIPDGIRGFLTIVFCGLAIVPLPSLVSASVRIKIITDEFSEGGV